MGRLRTERGRELLNGGHEAESRSPAMEPHLEPTNLNRLSFETSWGYRTVALLQGDISSAGTDAIVLSSHANPQFEPGGATWDAMLRRHGLDAPTLVPLVVLREGAAGTYRCEWSGRAPTADAFVVRLPSSKWHADEDAATRYFDEVVWTLFGSFAALELRDDAYETIAVPLIGGQRGYSRDQSMESILRHATAWLHRSKKTSRIEFYAFDASSAESWNEAMDRVLGRHNVSIAGDAGVAALRQEILALLTDARVLQRFDHPGTIQPLVRELEMHDELRVHVVGTFARRLTEELVSTIVRSSGGKPAHALYENIENRLRQTGRVAPWIIAHCHTLREFGNEAVHARARGCVPKSMGQIDVLALLSSLLRVLQFSLEWSASSGELKE